MFSQQLQLVLQLEFLKTSETPKQSTPMDMIQVWKNQSANKYINTVLQIQVFIM